LKPDITIFSATDPDISLESSSPPHWRAVDLWIENKNKGDDVFRKLDDMRKEAKEGQDLRSHIKWTKAAYAVSGQLIAYADAIHRSQFRVFSFSVVLFGNTGRLLRWDRSGIVYTAPFDWPEQHDTLYEFLWRINHLSYVDRGYDTTVTSVEGDVANAALAKLITYPGLENVTKSDLYKFLVRDDHTSDGHVKYYVTAGAIWDSKSLFGRSTYGYIAYDMETTNLVYLKDFWRKDLPDIQKEGDVYRELHRAGVSNIARLGLAGDVPLSPDAGLGVVQRTRAQDCMTGSGNGDDGCPGRPSVDPYVHYRLVLETLGKPLMTFKSTRQLCEVIRDAIVGTHGLLTFPVFSILSYPSQLIWRRTTRLTSFIGMSAQEIS